MNRHFTLSTPQGPLHGYLERPEQPRGLMLIAHIERTDRGDLIATGLVAQGYATLNMELLTARERQFADTAQNVPRLSQRLLDLLDLLRDDGDTEDLPLALFAAGDVTPAAIRVAAQRDMQVRVLACHGGLIDRAGRQALELMNAPLLMLFDADDDLNQAAFRRARSHLHGPYSELVLAADEDAEPYIGAWLARHLPAVADGNGSAELGLRD
ncbi:hypothetical protein [Azonexus sp.]|jgi:hypothetical protein|uniref:hypothetical protein n=1 Tax=Azonexus sp. TaxID=1872668 RepID=UPI00283121AE|nr:hypothetical protein [Azonexus sp.]MDR1994272.1 hypothetical protein [Azonexus sp.]